LNVLLAIPARIATPLAVDSEFSGTETSMLSKFALSQGVSEDKVDDWRKQLNKSEKIGNFGFTSFPVLTAAYLG